MSAIINTMKCLYFLLSLIFVASRISYAQTSSIALTLNHWSLRNFRVAIDDTAQQTEVKGTNVLPSVGYYRILGKRWGIGLEVGYANQNYRSEESHAYSTDILNVRYSRSYREYFFSPLIFERTELRKYILTGSICLPITIYANWEDKTYNESRSQPSHELLYWDTRKENYPNVLLIGVYVGISIQRKIFKGLYGGPQIGFGLIQNTTRGTYRNDYYDSDNSQRLSTKEIDQVSSQFAIRSSFSLSYYF